MADISDISRELECLRDFQMWNRERDTSEIREREHQRASESEREETCRLRACLVNRDCVIAILNLCYRHLESVICSSMNIATESTVGLCEHLT